MQVDYDALHRHWDEVHTGPSPVFRVRSALVRSLLPDSGVGRPALDVGSGTGLYSQELLRRGFFVDAFDPSPLAIERLEARLMPEAQGRLKGVVAEIGSFKPRPEGYDLILCSEVLEHLDRDRAALGRLHSFQRPGGQLVITVPLAPELFGLEDRMSGHRRRYGRGEVLALVEETGYRVIRAPCYGFPTLYLYTLAKKCWLTEGNLTGTATRMRTGGALTAFRLAARLMAGIDTAFRWFPYGVGIVILAERS